MGVFSFASIAVQLTELIEIKMFSAKDQHFY